MAGVEKARRLFDRHDEREPGARVTYP